MTELLGEAIARLRAIDAGSQNYWAWRILEGLEADRKWDEMIESPESQTMLERMAAEALAEHRAGLTRPIEELLDEEPD